MTIYDFPGTRIQCRDAGGAEREDGRLRMEDSKRDPPSVFHLRSGCTHARMSKNTHLPPPLLPEAAAGTVPFTCPKLIGLENNVKTSVYLCRHARRRRRSRAAITNEDREWPRLRGASAAARRLWRDKTARQGMGDCRGHGERHCIQKSSSVPPRSRRAEDFSNQKTSNIEHRTLNIEIFEMPLSLTLSPLLRHGERGSNAVVHRGR